MKGSKNESQRMNSPLGGASRRVAAFADTGAAIFCPRRRTIRRRRLSGEFIRWPFAFGLLLLLALPALAAPTLTVGSKRFPESEILGEVLTQLTDKTGEAQATHKMGLGNTGIVFAALKTGSIDVYPEYVGTISQELLKDKGQVGMGEMNAQLAPMGLAVGVPLGFNDGYGLAMREDEAQKLGITTLSDLAKHPDLKLGLSQEFLKRADGWEGLKAAYSLPFGTPEGFDHGAAYQALSGGQTDVADVYTTDAEIQKFHLRVLDDDRHYFPSYDAVLLYRAESAQAPAAHLGGLSRRCRARSARR